MFFSVFICVHLWLNKNEISPGPCAIAAAPRPGNWPRTQISPLSRMPAQSGFSDGAVIENFLSPGQKSRDPFLLPKMNTAIDGCCSRTNATNRLSSLAIMT